MKRILAIFLLLLFFGFGIAVNLRAEEDSTIEPNVQELRLLELINEARTAPLDMAASLGMDTEQILRDLPELKDVLTQGMNPLMFNPQLYLAAKAHNKDMLSNNYYSHTSPDGRNYKDRISETGYRAALSGESLGLVGFVNYMSADEAVRIIFENMFRDELNPGRTEKRNILDPDFRDIGVSFSSGSMTLGSSVRNVYLAVCEYARHEIVSDEVGQAFISLINQARENPSNAGEYFTDIYGINDNKGFSSDFSYLPLASNESLKMAASAHLSDMRDHLFFDHVSSDGKSPLERVAEAGYDAVYLNEIIGILVSGTTYDSDGLASVFFWKLLQEDMGGECLNFDCTQIFDSSVKDIGVASDVLTLETGDGNMLRIYLIVADFANDASVFGGGKTEHEKSLIIWDTDK